MAPYIVDGLHLVGYHSIMAAYQVRNTIIKNWPRTTVTLSNGSTEEIFDKLFLLFDDIYLSENYIALLGKNYKYLTTSVPSMTTKVGDYVEYTGSTHYYVNPGKYPDYDGRFVGQNLKVVEVISQGPSFFGYVFSVVKVEASIPESEAEQIATHLTPSRRKELLLDNSDESKRKRKKLYEVFGFEKMIEDATSGSGKTKWNSLDRLWVEISGQDKGDYNANKNDYYYIYTHFLELKKEYTFEIITTYSKDKSNKDKYVEMIDKFLNEPATYAHMMWDHRYIRLDIFNNETYTMDERFGIFLTILSSKKNYNIVHEFTSEIYSISNGEIYDPAGSEYVNPYDLAVYKSITFKLNNFTAIDNNEMDKGLEWIKDINERLSNSKNSHYSHSHNISSDLINNPYIVFFKKYMPSISLDVTIDSDLWVEVEKTGNNLIGQTSLYSMKTSGLQAVRSKDLQNIYRHMIIDYKEDDHGGSYLINTLVKIALLVVVVAATVLGQFYISVGLYGIAFAISLGAVAIIIGIQIAATNAGMYKTATIAGMMGKMYSISSMMMGIGSVLQNGIQKVITQVVEKYAITRVIKEIGKRIAESISSEAGAIFNVVASIFGSGISSSSSIEKISVGIIGAIESGMASYEKYESIRMTAPELSQEDKDTLKEIEKHDEKLKKLKEEQALSYLSDGIDTDQAIHSNGAMLESVDYYSELVVNEVNNFNNNIQDRYFKGST